MRCLLYRPSSGLKLAIYSLKRVAFPAILPSQRLKSGYPSYTTTASITVVPTIQSNARKSSGQEQTSQGFQEQLAWQPKLETVKQLEHESDLESLHFTGLRLVDQKENRHNYDIWLELLLYRRRVYGIKGILSIFLGMRNRDVLLASHPSVPTIWSVLLELGYTDYFVLHQICDLAENTYIRTGYRYPDLYVDIMRHFVTKENPMLVHRWHKKLRDTFPPTLEQYCTLVAHLNQPETPIKFTQFLRKAYEELSIQGVYKFIIPILCKAGLFQAALEWHHFLVDHRDLPATSEATDKLFDYLSLIRNSRQASKVTKDLLDGGVRFVSRSNETIDGDKLLTKGAMNLIHGKFYGIAPKELSDDFCARLFATRFFSIEHTIRGLEILGTHAIGPKALRELMARTQDSGKIDLKHAFSVLQQLSTARISIGRSVFARVVKELVTEHKADILHDVITCDMHFEAFEDRMLQESLLRHYCKTGDEKGIQRTLAILLVDTSDDPGKKCRSWNYLLRSAIGNRDWKEIYRILDLMEELEIEISKRSYNYMLQQLLSKRRVGRLPCTAANDLDPLINTWQSILRRGGSIPISMWSEVLLRLGMNGFLHEYEKLALWLVMWFAEPSFRSSQMSTRAYLRLQNDSRNTTDLVTTCKLFARHNARHPLRQLFPPSTVQAIVAWGFQHEYLHNYPQQSDFAVDKRTNPDSSSGAQWTWGLRLLCKLQALGVHFHPTTLGRACEVRLIGIFGNRFSGRPRNRVVQARHSHGCIEHYLASMEEILGKDLFRSIYPQAFALDETSRLQAIGRLMLLNV